MRRIKHNQHGDSIIEVLLAIAVIGMVLGASYATATRALRASRYAQEQTEALKLAESTVEKLKFIAGTKPANNTANDIFSTVITPNFCINDSLAKVASGDPSCTLISGLYNVSAVYVPADNLFRVVVTWQRTSASNGVVQVSYRLYE